MERVRPALFRAVFPVTSRWWACAGGAQEHTVGPRRRSRFDSWPALHPTALARR